jgi:Cu+-exporting ATPase
MLIKDAATLQKLHRVDVVVVDKTGTITKGKPELVSIRSEEAESSFLSKLAALEKHSEHPIAHAIMVAAKEKGLAIPETTAFQIIEGKGVWAEIDGTMYWAGNTKLMTDLGHHIDVAAFQSEMKAGRTPVLLANKDRVLGSAFIADAVKPAAKKAVLALHEMGIRVVMVTGDARDTAEAIAESVGIDEVIAEVLPEDKLRTIQELQAKGHRVAMAGDGVNDAPALAAADVGIAMATGTDVAIESAGITLLHGDIAKLAKAVRLSQITMRGIKQNLFWAFIYNVVGIPVAAGLLYPFFGTLMNPVFAGLAMALSSVSVVGNSLRLKTMKL